MLEGMAETTMRNQERLQAFQKRVAAGEPPRPGEPHTALEAVAALEAEGHSFDPSFVAILAEINEREIDAARSAVA